MDIRQRLERFDRGYLVVLAICLLAIWPFLTIPSLPEGTDAELHIFRLHELSGLVREGEFYPRWAPNFYHGYGYPIFNYYAPLTYYLALVPELLPGIDPVGATKLVFVAGLLLAGIGMYGYVRENWGRQPGYFAAALFVYAPYVQYVDPHMRGVSPESFSFAVFALALWALDRLRRRPGVLPWLASVLLVAAVILSHNLMGLLFFGMLTAWSAWQVALAAWRRQQKAGSFHLSGRLLLPVLALALGLGLATFFWLPVFLEREAVNLTTLLGTGDNYDFRTHFLPVIEMLSPSLRPDWGATQSPFRFNLGVIQWLAGLAGIILLVAGRLRRRGQALYAAVVLIILLFLMLPLSEPVWEALPFLPYFQFPWRLLGPAAAMLAILGGAGLDGLLRARRLNETGAGWTTAVAVALPMLFALPLSQPAPWPDFGEVNTLRLSEIENSGRWLGTTSTSDYVPVTVEAIPSRKPDVVAPLYAGLPPDRINREAMPDGAVIETETVRPLLTRYHVDTPKQFRLRLYQFDFPGWTVTIDGRPAETELASPEGFIVVLVPQGRHVVEVAFGTTPPRTVGWVIALGSLVSALMVAWRLRGRRFAWTLAPVRWRSEWPVPAMALAIAFTAAALAPLGLFHHASAGNKLDLPPAVEQFANLGDQIALLGFQPATEQVDPGDALHLMLYWKALRPLDIDYQVFVHVLDESGTLVAQSDRLNPGDFPTHRWPLDKYVPDDHTLRLPADLPPGRYDVRAGMWVQDEGWRLPLFDDAGTQTGDTVPLFQFEVP